MVVAAAITGRGILQASARIVYYKTKARQNLSIFAGPLIALLVQNTSIATGLLSHNSGKRFYHKQHNNRRCNGHNK